MNRTRGRCGACGFLAATVLMIGCQQGGDVPASSVPALAPAPRPALISHVVFFKLQDPSGAPALIDACDDMLSGIPGVVSYAAGRHIDTGRPTVDGDYDVGLYIGFDSEDAYAGYVDHPQHVALVNEWKPRLAWLRVYDIHDPTR